MTVLVNGLAVKRITAVTFVNGKFADGRPPLELCDELPDEEDLFAGDVPAPIAMCSHLIRSVPESVSERK